MGQVAGYEVPAGLTMVNIGRCRGCGARVMWCRTETGRGVAIDRDGCPHVDRCPDAERMLRGRFTLLDPGSEERAARERA